MIKMKTSGATVLLFAVVAAPVLAQDGGELGSRYPRRASSLIDARLRPGTARRTQHPPRGPSSSANSEMNAPGDFAVTGGLSNRSRAWNPTGQVDPGTSNSPAGNAGGE
jgi:hypothetical protein